MTPRSFQLCGDLIERHAFVVLVLDLLEQRGRNRTERSHELLEQLAPFRLKPAFDGQVQPSLVTDVVHGHRNDLYRVARVLVVVRLHDQVELPKSVFKRPRFAAICRDQADRVASSAGFADTRSLRIVQGGGKECNRLFMIVSVFDRPTRPP